MQYGVKSTKMLSHWPDFEFSKDSSGLVFSHTSYGVSVVSTWITFQWRHNGRDGVSNHQAHHCLLNRLSRRSSKKTSKLRVTGLCAGNSPVTGGFPPPHMASNTENVSNWWRHHEMYVKYQNPTVASDGHSVKQYAGSCSEYVTLASISWYATAYITVAVMLDLIMVRGYLRSVLALHWESWDWSLTLL